MLTKSVDPAVDTRAELPFEDSPQAEADHFRGHHYEMPVALLFVRETPEFTVKTVPTGLLKSHSLASHLWGRLTVHKGSVRFTFEEPEVFDIELKAEQHVDIPPLIHHHVLPLSGGSFSVSFFRKTPGE